MDVVKISSADIFPGSDKHDIAHIHRFALELSRSVISQHVVRYSVLTCLGNYYYYMINIIYKVYDIFVLIRFYEVLG